MTTHHSPPSAPRRSRHLEPRVLNALGPALLGALRPAVYLALFIALGLMAGRLAWRPAPLNPGPPPTPCDPATAASDWADRGLHVQVPPVGPGRASLHLQPTTLLTRPDDPACDAERWLATLSTARDTTFVSPRFAASTPDAPPCVAYLGPPSTTGSLPGAPALRVVYPDGTYAELDAALQRVDAPPIARLARATAAAPLAALALLALLWAAWLARAPLTRRPAAALTCAAALAAVVPLASPLLEVL